MSIEKLADWLKSSIPGIILLSAVGSILALLLIKLLFSAARVVARMARLTNHAVDHVTDRYIFLMNSFFDQCQATGNSTSVILLVIFKLFRFTLSGLGFFICLRTGFLAYIQSPKSPWLFPSVIGAQLLLLAIFLDGSTLIVTYAYYISFPMGRLKEKLKNKVSLKETEPIPCTETMAHKLSGENGSSSIGPTA